jgi:hypothetical protein
VRFEKITAEAAVDLLRREEELIAEVRRLRAAWRSRPSFSGRRGTCGVRVDGEPHRVEWETLD